MTAEEVEKYITQVAFSGAEDFVKQYKESEDEGKQIIGHFGLGFYSALWYQIRYKLIHYHIKMVQMPLNGFVMVEQSMK